MALGLQWNQPREKWDAWDPMLLSEGLFSAANIFSSLKLVYIFSVNPHLGPLQVSLSRMVLDILKFFVLDILVIFAFSCGESLIIMYELIHTHDLVRGMSSVAPRYITATSRTIQNKSRRPCEIIS